MHALFPKWLSRTTVNPVPRGDTEMSHPPVGPNQEAIDRLVEELYDSRKEIESIAKNFEHLFMNTATALEKLSDSGSIFIEKSAYLVAAATGKDRQAGIYAEAVNLLRPPLNYLCECYAQSQRILNDLKMDMQRISELIEVQADLQKGMAPLKFIQTLFRVESATQDPHVHMMFEALTKEIESLSKKMTDLFYTKFNELHGIQQTVATVVSVLQIQAQTLDEVVNRQKSQIDASLSQLEHDLCENQLKEPAIGRLSRAVGIEIQQAVVGMQFQDIVNQKLQHTVAALGEIRAKFHSPEGSLLFIKQSCHLESEQLLAVARDLKGAEEAISGSTVRIVEHLQKANAQCLALSEFERLTTSADGMLQQLLDVFGNIRHQVSTAVSNCSAAYQTLRPIGNLASDLTSVVRSLSMQIHLIGLNAQVQAAQLNKGLGLEVLSARTSEISRQTNHLSDKVASQLDRLIASITGSLKSLEELNQSARAQQEILNQTGVQMEQRLHGVRDEALTTLSTIDELIDQISTQAEEMGKSIRYKGYGEDKLKQVQEKLAKLSLLAQQQMPADAAQQQVLVCDFKKAYTMFSEREVFERAISTSSDAQSPPPPDSQAPPAIDLFDSTAGELCPPGAIMESPALTGQPCLDQSTDQAAGEPTRQEGCRPKLENCVELF